MTTFKQFLEQHDSKLTLRRVIQGDHRDEVKRDLSGILDVSTDGIQIDAGSDARPDKNSSNALTVFIDIPPDTDEELFKNVAEKTLTYVIGKYFERPFKVDKVSVFDGRNDAQAHLRPDGAHYFVSLHVVTV